MEKFTNDELKESMDKYSSQYDEGKFWDFVKEYGKKAGKSLLEQAFMLYLVLKKEGVPLTAKGIIMGGLAYLVCPIDLIPDFIPVLGLTDDAAAVALAIHQLTSYIDASVEKEAEKKVEDLLG